MSRLNYTPILRYVLREYDDQPLWTVHFQDDNGHPIKVRNVGTFSINKRNDYDFVEMTLCFYKKRGGVYGVQYCYMSDAFSMDMLSFENETTHKRYTVEEYEEYVRTHTMKEGGLSDARVITKWCGKHGEEKIDDVGSKRNNTTHS